VRLLWSNLLFISKHKEKITPKKTVCTVVKKYKEHGQSDQCLQGYGKLPKRTTEILLFL
jgi:hypothetical protein